jgi:hypothetical protein
VITCGECQLRFSAESVRVDARHSRPRHVEPVLPTRLREFLPPIVRGELPAEPIDISPVPLD